MRALALFALAACTHTAVSVTPMALARHQPELAAHGSAEVEVEEGGTFRVDGEQVVGYTIAGNERTHLWGLVRTGVPDEARTATLANVVAGCDPSGAGRGCQLSKIRDPIRVGERRHLDPGMLAIGLFGAVVTVAGFACLAVCSSRSDWELVGTGIGVGTMLYPFTTVF